jgi:hypothetical protein
MLKKERGGPSLRMVNFCDGLKRLSAVTQVRRNRNLWIFPGLAFLSFAFPGNHGFFSRTKATGPCGPVAGFLKSPF